MRDSKLKKTYQSVGLNPSPLWNDLHRVFARAFILVTTRFFDFLASFQLRFVPASVEIRCDIGGLPIIAAEPEIRKPLHHLPAIIRFDLQSSLSPPHWCLVCQSKPESFRHISNVICHIAIHRHAILRFNVDIITLMPLDKRLLPRVTNFDSS